MKNKIVLIIGVLFAVNVVYSIGQYCPVPNKNGGYIHNGLNSANSRSSVDDGENLVWKEGNILKQMENERQLKNQCKKLEIRFLQRPLSMDKNGDFQNMSDGTISHVQIVAYDKVTGEYYDDFGYSFRNSILKEEKGMVFSEGEKQVRKLYNKNEPLGIIEVDSDDYEKIKKASVEKLESIYYAPLNSVDVKSYVMEGTVKGVGLGAAVGGINGAAMGGINGAISGVLSAASEYSGDGRGNYKIVSVDKTQMSMPGVNCQTAADIVVEIGEWLFSENEIRSWNVLKKYVQPGSYSANSKKKESDDKAFSYKATSEVFNSDLKGITRVQGEDEVSEKLLTNNVAKTDADDSKAMGDKCDVIKAIEQLSSCMKERNAAIDSVVRRLPKKSMSDIRGILSDGDAISAESARYAERVEKCIETLNVSFLKMEKEFSNDSTVQINAIREKRYNSIKPHIIELFEILRDSPDKIRHRVENVIPIHLARYLVNCDNRIRKKYYLLPSFGFEL